MSGTGYPRHHMMVHVHPQSWCPVQPACHVGMPNIQDLNGTAKSSISVYSAGSLIEETKLIIDGAQKSAMLSVYLVSWRSVRR